MDLGEVEECLAEETVHEKAPRWKQPNIIRKPPAVPLALSRVPGERGEKGD